MSEREQWNSTWSSWAQAPQAWLPPFASSSVHPKPPCAWWKKLGEVGAHILSGAVIEPRAMDELLPNWRELGCPLETEAKEDHFVFLTKKATTARLSRRRK